MIHNPTELTQVLANLFAELPQVESVALSGSRSGDQIDAASDIDLYIYTHSDIAIDDRRAIVSRSGGASYANLGLNYWGPGDEWFDAATGIEVDIVYFDARWMDDQIQRVMQDHQPSLGYSTCFAYTIRNSQVFYDPQGWFGKIQNLCQQPYSEALCQNIVKHNHPVLRQIIPSYFYQIEKAVKRGDLISVNHRLAGLFASYFDIIFAINRALHPGEKRLLQKAVSICKKLPKMMETDITEVLTDSVTGDESVLSKLSELLDRLDNLLQSEGFGSIED